MNSDFKNHLYKPTYLNEISDKFIRKMTGINVSGKRYNNFYTPERRGEEEKRITRMLNRNMANQLSREEKESGEPFIGNVKLSSIDPYRNSIPGFKDRVYTSTNDFRVAGLNPVKYKQVIDYYYKKPQAYNLGIQQRKERERIGLSRQPRLGKISNELGKILKPLPQPVQVRQDPYTGEFY